MPNDPAGRYGASDETAYQGFHTYATSDLYDTSDGTDQWPDNWADGPEADDERQQDYADEDEEPSRYRAGSGRDYWAVLMWTIVWYTIPVLVLIARALTLPRASAARTAALSDFISNSPIWLLALSGGLALAAVLRWASETWRATTIGFCAAVVSGGALTVLYRIW